MAGTLLFLAGTGPAAYAFWETLSSNNAAAAADALSAGRKPAVTASGTTMFVSWAATATAGGHPASGYTVTRYGSATGGTAVPATGACGGTVTSLSCSESGVPGGVWYYTVTPSIALWKGAESPRSDGASSDSTAPVATASITPAPNAAGWNNTSPVTFTINAQDESGGSGVASVTYQLDSGPAVTVNAATASFPISGDGNHTVTYSATDKAGNVSAAVTQTVKIDTSRPAVPVLSVPAYVNTANVSAVPVSGTAEANSTVTVTASDAGAAHTVTVQTTASATGSWSLNMNLTSLNQGTVNYSVTATDAAVNTSPAAVGTGKKDTVAPTAAGIALANGNGTLARGDTVTITYSEAMDPGKLCTGFTNWVVISNGADLNNDVLTMEGCPAFGNVTLGGNYVGTLAARFGSNGTGNPSSYAWDAESRTLTITVGQGSALTSPSGFPSYTPTVNLTDAAGNPASTTPVTSSTQTNF